MGKRGWAKAVHPCDLASPSLNVLLCVSVCRVPLQGGTMAESSKVGMFFVSQYYKELLKEGDRAHLFYHEEAGTPRLQPARPASCCGWCVIGCPPPLSAGFSRIPEGAPAGDLVSGRDNIKV